MPRRERLVGMKGGGEGGGKGEGAGARLFIHSQGCRQEGEIKVGKMSSFGIYVFRVAWTVGPAVFDHRGRGLPLRGPTSSVPGVGGSGELP